MNALSSSDSPVTCFHSYFQVYVKYRNTLLHILKPHEIPYNPLLLSVLAYSYLIINKVPRHHVSRSGVFENLGRLSVQSGSSKAKHW
jgi:hypothetical protein